MTPAEIKLKRTESILKELIPEALSELNDSRLREIDVIDVTCSKGRSDAKVYLDPHNYSDEERRTFLKQLKKRDLLSKSTVHEIKAGLDARNSPFYLMIRCKRVKI